MDKKKQVKICLISSSGGHYEQLKMLQPLGQKYDIFFVTENIGDKKIANYFLFQDKGNRLWSIFLMCLNCIKSFFLFIRTKPDVVITTGTKVALGMVLCAKIFRKKIIYIESFARIYDGTRFGKFIYKHRLYNKFIYQWETLKDIYPDGEYGGGIY